MQKAHTVSLATHTAHSFTVTSVQKRKKGCSAIVPSNFPAYPPDISDYFFKDPGKQKVKPEVNG